MHAKVKVKTNEGFQFYFVVSKTETASFCFDSSMRRSYKSCRAFTNNLTVICCTAVQGHPTCDQSGNQTTNLPGPY